MELMGFERPVNWHQADADEALADAIASKALGNDLFKQGRRARRRTPHAHSATEGASPGGRNGGPRQRKRPVGSTGLVGCTL